MAKARVLFLCTHNSARSQMAEGLLRLIAGDRFEVVSAGTKPTTVHPLAARAMDEIGIDPRNHFSKPLTEFLGQPWDYVITLCDDARERCPVFPERTQRLHWAFPDPSLETGSEAQQLSTVRWVRDNIRDQIVQWLGDLGDLQSAEDQPAAGARLAGPIAIGLVIAVTCAVMWVRGGVRSALIAFFVMAGTTLLIRTVWKY